MTTSLPTPEGAGSWPAPGAKLAARYEVVDVIGRGGSSIIYRAKELGLGREVALKVLDLRGEPDAIEQRKKRFYRAARLLAQLNAPSTVRMFDYGRTPDGLLFLVFEYIDGHTLEDALKRGPIEPDRARSILLQILESLREAHALGFLHRDIKPANVMLYKRLGQPDGVKLLDFGIAKELQPADLEQITMAGQVVGTPRYLAPERVQGKPPGPTSDIFSLGLLTYAMLVGQSPVSHLRDVDVLRALTSERFRLPDGVKVDDQLREVVDRMLEPKPHRRFQTIDDLLDALGVHLEPVRPEPVTRSDELVAFPVDLDPMGGTPVDELTGTTNVQSITLTTSSLTPPGTVVKGDPVEEDAVVEAPVPEPEMVEKPPRRSRWIVWLLLGVVVAVGIGLALLASRTGEDEPQPDPESEGMVFEGEELADSEQPVGPAVERSSADVRRAVGFARMAAELRNSDGESSPGRAKKQPEPEPGERPPPEPRKLDEGEPGFEIKAMDELE